MKKRASRPAFRCCPACSYFTFFFAVLLVDELRDWSPVEALELVLDVWSPVVALVLLLSD